MNVETGDIVEVTTERPATGGAVAHLDDGRVAFVRLGLPGERLSVRVSEVRSRFVRAEVVEVISPSAERVESPCPHAGPGKCGGCDLQHASPEAQLDWKASLVNEHLARIAKVEMDIELIPGGEARGSRTRLRCGVDDEGALGLRRAGSHEIIALDDCWLADERLAPAFTRSWDGFDEVELRAIGDGEPFVVAHPVGAPTGAVRTFSLDGQSQPNARSLVSVGDIRFGVGAQSFWQSHRRAPEMLTELVTSALQASEGDRVVDFYSGVGLFAVPLARAVGSTGRVDAVEASSVACDDMRRNARRGDHLRVREWMVSARAVNDLVYEGSLVVLDPPRSGAGVAVISAIVKRRPRRVVYVSCDAATFARDVKEALKAGYSLSALNVLDLFPMTEHVEIVGVLDSPL